MSAGTGTLPPQPVASGHLPINDWLEKRIVCQFNPQNKGYEYSLYGAMNALLSTQFPLHQKFMIKPQGGLRATEVALRVQELSTKTSGGSSSSAMPLYADFLICKADEELYKDRIVCIVEIKRKGENQPGAEQQLRDYLRRATNEVNKVRIIFGFLVIGSSWYAYSVDTLNPGDGASRELALEGGFSYGVEFKRALFHVAQRYW